MLQIERIEIIKKILSDTGSVEITELSKELNISTSTIRRCLKQLEEENFAELIRGGAILASCGVLYEQPYDIKRKSNLEEKMRIATEAKKYLRSSESIFLDSSSTVFNLTKYVKDVKKCMVATNDLLIASALTYAQDVTVCVIGGTLRKHYFTTTGLFAESILKDVYIDTAFMGIDAVNIKGGLTLTNVEEVQVKKMVIRAASKVIVLCDHTKFDQTSFLNVCKFEDVYLLITGKELSDELYSKYVEAGLKIIRV